MSRPIWKGSIVFGLVNIPIQLETAVREKTIRFHLLNKDGTCRLRQRLYCPDSGKEFDFGQTARGIEIAPGQYVLMDKDELNRIKPERGRSIQIQQFVELDKIDPIYFDAAYYITPLKESLNAYRLFHQALKESQRAGLAQIVLHDRQHVSAVRVMGEGLVMHTMHYADEVLSLAETLPASLRRTPASAKEMRMARQLIDEMTQPLDLASFKDDYSEQLQTLIDRKKQGKKTTDVLEDVQEFEPGTINLMEALKRSLESTHKPTNHHPHRKSA